MADFEMDFQWPRATSYEIKIPPRLHPSVRTYDQVQLFSEEWEDFEGEGAKSISEKLHIVAHRLDNELGEIVPKGPSKLVRPDSRALDAAVEALLGLTGSIDITTVSIERFIAHIAEITPAIINIVASTGMLYAAHYDSPVFWYALALNLKDYFAFREESGRAEMPTLIDLDLSLVASIKNGPTIAMRPATLADAILLHAVRSISAGTTFFACEACKTPFLSGGSRGRGKKKAGAQFCCEQCRWNYNNAKRRKA